MAVIFIWKRKIFEIWISSLVWQQLNDVHNYHLIKEFLFIYLHCVHTKTTAAVLQRNSREKNFCYLITTNGVKGMSEKNMKNISYDRILFKEVKRSKEF